jgi:beta-lactamase superfamily II metal-dependent hydrolase
MKTFFLLLALWQFAAAQTPALLTFYFLDMNGGASTLIVTPSGESVLIDTGSLQPEGRDSGRILQACKDANLVRIDHLITTHFHSDHFGAVAAVTKKIPVRYFYDKGAPPSLSEQQSEWYRQLWPLYQEATQGKARKIARRDRIPLLDKNLQLCCVAAEKAVVGFDGDIDASAPGFAARPADESDNGRSIALLLSYGDFSAFMGGDITHNVEQHLVWPVNRLGQVDLYQVTHHGWDLSNNPLLIKSIEPVIAVAPNGPQKGVQPITLQTLRSVPSLKALYQLHYNVRYGDSGNTAPEFIANTDPSHGGGYVRVTVDRAAQQMRVRLGPDGTDRVYSY